MKILPQHITCKVDTGECGLDLLSSGLPNIPCSLFETLEQLIQSICLLVRAEKSPMLEEEEIRRDGAEGGVREIRSMRKIQHTGSEIKEPYARPRGSLQKLRVVPALQPSG